MPGRPSVLSCLLAATLAAGCAPGGVVAPTASGPSPAATPAVAPAPAQDARPRRVPAWIKIGLFVGGLGWVSLGLLAALKMSERTGRRIRECLESYQVLTEPLWGYPAISWMFGWMLLWGTVFVLLVVL